MYLLLPTGQNKTIPRQTSPGITQLKERRYSWAVPDQVKFAPGMHSTDRTRSNQANIELCTINYEFQT